MDLSLSGEQKLLQKINPLMFQSLNILQLNAVELRDLVIRECEKNPAVELVERKNSSRGDVDWIFNGIRAEQSMEEYLLDQVPEWSDSDKNLLLTILKNLDGRGFFTGDVDSIAAEHRITPEKVSHVLDELKTLKPYGLGAKDLAEALLIQVKNIPRIDGKIRSVAERVISAHLSDLLRGSFKKIAIREKMAIGEVKAIAKLVSRLSFAPLSFFGRDVAPAVIPDIKFFKREGEWIIDVNDGYCPQFRFSGTYKDLLSGQADGMTVKYLKDQARSARLLANAIARRKETLLGIAQSILSRQMQFFEYGPKWLKRLSMGEVAGDISVNVSTVSRAVSEKYAETPHGVFKLSAFFESGVGDCSATFIKAEMEKLISNSSEQLSDRKIAEILTERGIRVSRRTIAKYRQKENLPNSRIRKIFRFNK